LDGLTLFGLFAVSAMLVTYALEQRSRWYILGFAAACGLGSIHAYPVVTLTHYMECAKSMRVDG
jgi:hypothetical protein